MTSTSKRKVCLNYRMEKRGELIQTSNLNGDHSCLFVCVPTPTLGSALKGDVITLLNVLKQEQISPRSAAKITANVSSLKRKEVYKMYHGMVKTVDDGVFAEGRADGDSDNDALDAQSDDTETGSRYQEDEEKVRGGTT